MKKPKLIVKNYINLHKPAIQCLSCVIYIGKAHNRLLTEKNPTCVKNYKHKNINDCNKCSSY